MRGACGITYCSSFALYGIGKSSVVDAKIGRVELVEGEPLDAIGDFGPTPP